MVQCATKLNSFTRKATEQSRDKTFLNTSDLYFELARLVAIMEKDYAGNKIIPCKDIKNEHYVEILREYEEGNFIFSTSSGEKFLKTKKWGCIPLLAQHPIAVRSKNVEKNDTYFF